MELTAKARIPDIGKFSGCKNPGLRLRRTESAQGTAILAAAEVAFGII
jgi:hypothetical protein